MKSGRTEAEWRLNKGKGRRGEELNLVHGDHIHCEAFDALGKYLQERDDNLYHLRKE